MPYGAADLKNDLTEKINTLNQREQQEFISQLVTYTREMTQVKPGDRAMNSLMSGIDEWLEEYFFPLNPDNSFNHALGEERLRKFNDFHVEKQLEAGTYLEDLAPHSASWKNSYLCDHDPDAPYMYAVGNLSYTFGMYGKYSENLCIDFVQKGDGSQPYYLESQMTTARLDRMRNASPEEQRALEEGHRLFQPNPENNEREKQIKAMETPYGECRNFDKNYRQFADKLDFSFIKDREAARAIRGVQLDSSKSPVRQLADRMSQMEAFLNSKENSRWRGDSSYMKAVKNNLKQVKELIEIQGSGSHENRAAIAEAYEQLKNSCAAYLEKRSGERMTGTGSRRQRAIADLAEFLNDNTAVRDMMEEDRREMEARPAAGPAVQEKHPEWERMDFNALNRESQSEHTQRKRRNSVTASMKRPELEHAEPSKERDSLGR